MLDFDLIKNRLSRLLPKDRIFTYSITASTNTRAIEYARIGGCCPAVFIAEEQTGGRGRRGRSFVSNPDAGIYISFLLHTEAAGGVEGATAFAAVALLLSLPSEVRDRVGIKWVNDIVSRSPKGNGKKLAGILAEAITENSSIDKIVIGMGINVYKNAISDEISQIATSIEEVSGNRFARENIVSDLTEKMLSGMKRDEVLSAYRKASLTVGRRVTVLPHSEEPYEALATEILEDYSLLVEKKNGETVRVFSGEVSTIIKQEKKDEG